MKKRVLILVGLCTIGLCAWETQASVPQQNNIHVETEDNHIPSGAEQIKLRGRLDYNIGPDGIEAGATEQSVYLYFNQNFGNVSVSLYSPTGILIYNCVVNVSMQQLVVIPIASSVSGTYTVVLDNANGFVEGDFEHD